MATDLEDVVLHRDVPSMLAISDAVVASVLECHGLGVDLSGLAPSWVLIVTAPSWHSRPCRPWAML